MSKKIRPLILVITGPCGSGKTTITKLVAKRLDFQRVSGDEIKENLYPEIGNITDYPGKLEKVKIEILKKTEILFKKGENVVVDYVILGEDQIQKYRNIFLDNLIIKVLLPKRDKIIERDKTRECWTSGEKCINYLYEKFNKLKGCIGHSDFIDNSNEKPEETYTKHFKKL